MSESTRQADGDDSRDLFAHDHGLDERQARRAEDHRGFVREMHNRLNKTYGYGGGLVLLALIAVVVVAAVTGWWAEWMYWVPGLTAVIAVLYGARTWIYGREDRMEDQVEEYCEANDLSVDVLLEYYEAEETYPFFVTIFEDNPRRIEDRPDESSG